MTRVHMVIRGHVQGVCFRMCACEEAERLGVNGWVRNRSDGSVEVVAEGAAPALDEFSAWCRRGPDYASVTGVDEERIPGTGEFSSFRITR